MQQHLNGFRPGDPDVKPARDDAAPGHPLGEVDVLIVGSGPAGLVLAAQLSRLADLTVRVIERRAEPLQLGQADGVACRTVEMFEAFGLSEQLLRESCWITETVFWGPDRHAGNQIARTGRIQDVEDGLSEFPHVILNQARVQDLLLEQMAHSPSRLEPDHGLEVTALSVAESGTHPVTVTLRRLEDGTTETVRARYVVGCDGARSVVREQIGRHLVGESANHAWGVMDVLAVTDFPDVRRKALIQSEAGTLMIIPREGGYLFRMYVEMAKLEPGERVRSRQIAEADVIAAARRILHPHTLNVREVVWWSVYEVGQRLTDRFDDADEDDPEQTPRVFIAGDACHTHSPKAGQGMNVSMQDAYNLGWKLAAVLQGRSAPSLLRTYSAERRAVAQELIDFDRHWSAFMATRPTQRRPGEDRDGDDGPSLQEQFAQQGRYTAGVATRYAPSALTGDQTWQHLATGFCVGTRFHSAPVVRLADSRPMQLGHVHEADGRWRLYAFGDHLDVRDPASRLRRLCDLLEEEDSPLWRHTLDGADPDSVLDLRGVVQQGPQELEVTALPRLLRPTKGRYGLVDYEKVFCADPRDDLFESRGIDRSTGALVVVRPDQYVGDVLPLTGVEVLGDYLAGALLSTVTLVR